MPINSRSLFSFSTLGQRSAFGIGGCAISIASSPPKSECCICAFSCWNNCPYLINESRKHTPFAFTPKYSSRCKPNPSKLPLFAKFSKAFRFTLLRSIRSTKSNMFLYGPFLSLSLTIAIAAPVPIPFIAERPKRMPPFLFTLNPI